MSGGTQQAPALVVQHLTKRVGARVAYNDVCFEVGRGEVSFLGTNEAGKTTMVRTLGTPDRPDLGHSDPSPVSRSRPRTLRLLATDIDPS